MKENKRQYSHSEITQKLKQSTMSDDFLNKVITLHNLYPDSFGEMILTLRFNVKRFLDSGFSVIETYDILKENRVIRCSEDDSLIGFEKNLFKILFECFTEYGSEIVTYELLKGLKEGFWTKKNESVSTY
jgi:hypothetical protein